jgi:hypothetical protein
MLLTHAPHRFFPEQRNQCGVIFFLFKTDVSARYLLNPARRRARADRIASTQATGNLVKSPTERGMIVPKLLQQF